MIKINPIEDTLKEQYFEKAKPFYISFLEEIFSDNDYQQLIEYLDFNKTGEEPIYNNDKLKNLLIGEKEKLIEIIGNIGTKSKNRYAKRCYEQFANTDFMKSWAKTIGVDSCPYCNMNYLNSTSNNSTRSEFDHYFPKSIYPYLCISMYNLIPCCHDCNHNKLDLDPVIDSFTYPFLDEFGENIVFDVNVLKDGSIVNNANPLAKHKFDLNIIDRFGAKLPIYINSEISILKLKEKYILRQRQIDNIYCKVIKYNEKYRSGILRLKIFHWLTPEASDFCDIVSKNEWISTPLAKLNYDIFNKFKR